MKLWVKYLIVAFAISFILLISDLKNEMDRYFILGKSSPEVVKYSLKPQFYRNGKFFRYQN